MNKCLCICTYPIYVREDTGERILSLSLNKSRVSLSLASYDVEHELNNCQCQGMVPGANPVLSNWLNRVCLWNTALPATHHLDWGGRTICWCSFCGVFSCDSATGQRAPTAIHGIVHGPQPCGLAHDHTHDHQILLQLVVLKRFLPVLLSQCHRRLCHAKLTELQLW